MRHHRDAMANADPIKPINGKKLILFLGVGAVVFTVVMGYGTFFMAKAMAPLLQKNAPKAAPQGAMTLDSPQKK